MSKRSGLPRCVRLYKRVLFLSHDSLTYVTISAPTGTSELGQADHPHVYNLGGLMSVRYLE